MPVGEFLIENIIVAVVLSIDATVVAFSQGIILKKHRLKNSLVLAFFLGFFQFLMPLIGWWLGDIVHSFFEAFAHWLAFLIFVFLGIKIIVEATSKNNVENIDSCKELHQLSLRFLYVVSIATSIDAFGAGISFNFLNKPFLFPSIIIGIITFINSFIGFWSGYCLKTLKTKNIEIAAGIILILLAIKILLSSFSFT